jgi:hypothetical protein
MAVDGQSDLDKIERRDEEIAYARIPLEFEYPGNAQLAL